MSKPNPKRRESSHPFVAAVVPPLVAAVLQPVAKRLSRIEDLLFEMRFEQDLQAKRVSVLKEKLDALTEHRVPRRARPASQNRPGQFEPIGPTTTG
jgi:hypothetical protein